MAVDNLFTRLIANMGRFEAKNQLVSHYAPPVFDDVLHDGLVGSGETWGGILGYTAGRIGGAAAGGPAAGIAGATILGPLGALAGGWAAHGAYRQGQLINNILTHPENWTVDAAGAIVPVLPDPDALGTANAPKNSGATTPQSGAGTIGQGDGGPPVRFLPSLSQNPLQGGVADWPSSVSLDGPLYAAQPSPPADQPGGLPGMLLEYLRNNPNPY